MICINANWYIFFWLKGKRKGSFFFLSFFVKWNLYTFYCDLSLIKTIEHFFFVLFFTYFGTSTNMLVRVLPWLNILKICKVFFLTISLNIANWVSFKTSCQVQLKKKEKKHSTRHVKQGNLGYSSKSINYFNHCNL